MRIISGIYKGRNLKGYTIDGTRPTQDRVKESIFSTIQNYVPGSVALDLFAGSGNLGIEALSNGAIFTHLVDINKIACETVKDNLNMINEKNAKVYNLDYKKALKQFKENKIKFDLVFLDPPYKDLILEEILNTLVEYDLLKENALVICEYEVEHTKDNYPQLELIKNKKYGSKYVKIYQKNN